jgi:hypothetical protein
MEMLIIAVIAIVAFAAVLIPLFRRSPGASDAREFDGDPAPAARTARTAAKKTAPTHAPPAAPSAPVADPAQGEGRVPPMVSGPVSPVDASDAETDTGDAVVPPHAEEDEIELEVQRYRAALRAGTICSKCGQANPADSAFCFDCGGALPRAEAREFE